MIQMNNQQIHLFVQEGCRPCQYVKTQLAKVKGWESLITITDSKCCDEWTNFAKESGVIATPTLVAFEGGEVVARQAGSQTFTTQFFQGLIDKYKASSTASLHEVGSAKTSQNKHAKKMSRSKSFKFLAKA